MCPKGKCQKTWILDGVPELLNSMLLFWMCATQILTQQKWVILGDNLNLQTIHESIQIKPELFLEVWATFN